MNNRKSNAQNLVELARTEAEKIIEKNKSDMGIFASVEGYREVWARDSVIAFLGAAFGKEEGVMKSFFNTLETLRKYQNRFGQIPNYIAEEKKIFLIIPAMPANGMPLVFITTIIWKTDWTLVPGKCAFQLLKLWTGVNHRRLIGRI